MAVRAPAVALVAAGAIACINQVAHAGYNDLYIDAAVLLGQPLRVVHDDGSCANAGGEEREKAQLALSRFAQREQTRVSVGNGPYNGLDIQFVLSSQVAADPAFVAGLERAAQLWESHIHNPIVITMAVDFTSNQPFLAAASTTLVGSSYETLRGAMLSSASLAERAYVSRMPLTIGAHGETGLVTSSNGISFFPPSALRRALNIENWTPNLDGQIVFNTDYDFDPDPSDGLTPGQVDLVTVMCHELGHTLGFTSSVDANEMLRQPLDIFRFGTLSSPSNPETLDDVTTAVREWRAGVEAALDTVNAIVGVPQEIRFSTGAYNGDGRQASHWKDDSLLGLSQAIGVMDPTYQASHVAPGIITDADLLALSLLGWDIDIGTSPCEGDATGDGLVNLDDLQLLLYQFGTHSEEADINFDGVVNIMDLQLMLFLFNTSCLGGA